jgi:hypothetical protein
MGINSQLQGKLDDLIGPASLLGKNLSQRAFGEKGPDLKMTLADLEQALKPLVQAMAAGFLSAATREQAGRLSDTQACPTCGRECPQKRRERKMTGENGPFTWPEPVCHCEHCERSFFPPADRAED